MTISSVIEGENVLKKHYDIQLKNTEKSKIENDVSWVKLKYSHSYDVFKVGENLINNDKIFSNLNEDYKLFGKLGCLLHDVGRFYEVGEKKLNGIPHGVFGAEDILKNIEGENNSFLLLSLKYHDDLYAEEKTLDELSKLNLSTEENEIIINLLHLVMDSDKLSNFELFQKIDTRFFISEKKDLYFTDICFEDFKNRRLIKRHERETVFDSILSYISWFYDLNLNFSKELVSEKNYAEGFLKMFENEINDFEKIEENKKKLDEVYEKIELIKTQLKEDKFLQ